MLTPKATDARQYLLPEVVSRLKNLDLIARFIVEGFLVGLHKSPFHGFSVEFSEHRQYMPGDNIRDIDWKVYGRTDRYYIKQYEEETNLKANILVDISGSMGYSSHGITKLEYAVYLAAALSYLLLKQRDAVGLALFSDKIHRYLPPKSTSSYIKFLLSGVINAEYTIASTTGLTDQSKRDWDWKLIDRLKFNRNLFPPIVEPGEKVGELLPSISKITGLKNSTPIIATG